MRNVLRGTLSGLGGIALGYLVTAAIARTSLPDLVLAWEGHPKESVLPFVFGLGL